MKAGDMTEEDERLLKERVRPKGNPDLKDSAFNIICARKVAGEMNAKYVRELPGEMIEIDAVNFKANHKTFKPTLHKSGDGTIGKTGFMNKLKLKVGAKVMLIKNIRTEDGLTNGQTGKLAHVVRDSKGGVKYLMVRFNRENVGKMTRNENPELERLYPGCTKIEKTLETYKLKETGANTANLIQFPIVLAHAVTCLLYTSPSPRD